MIKTSEQYQLMKEGKSYHFDDYLFTQQKKCSKLNIKINNLPFGNSKREVLLKRLLGSLGNNSIIKANFICNFGFNISIGNDCYINHSVTILDSYEVVIGNNVFIGPGVIIAPVTHPNIAEKRRDLIIKKVVIEDDAWIGSGAIILPGVTIHKGAVVGAGAVVLHDVDPNTIVVGVPTSFLKNIEQ